MSRNSARNRFRAGAARRPSGGFTLMELLTSIGIIIFLLSIAIVAVGPAFRSVSTKDAARRTRATLDAARIRAIQQRRAVRFEAQLFKRGPEQWVVTPNAGDPLHEWAQLPSFTTLRTSATGTSFDEIDKLSVTFGADGAIVAVTVDDSPVLESPPTSVFLIRLHTTREAPADEVDMSTCFIELTPLTGVIRSYGSDEADPNDLPSNTE